MKTHIILTVLLIPILGYTQNQLFIPSILSGENIDLTLQTGSHQFLSGAITSTMGVNGNILGPTIILNQGDEVDFFVENQLDEPTTIHWHGLHVSPENDGGPHTVIESNTIWSPSFTILDRAGTYWYHPHLHKKTDKHVAKGIAGMIIVRDNEESQLDLPRNYGVDDIPLIIQTKDFDSNNQIVVHSNSDDVLMVNGTINSFIDVPAQIVRLRVLNGSSQRAFNLGLNNNKDFYQIASDGGLLDSPIPMKRIILAPGERAELLVDFTDQIGQTVQLISYASEFSNGVYGATNPGIMPMMTLDGYNPNPLNGSDFIVLDFNIGIQTSNAVLNVPSSLTTNEPWNVADANITRNLTFSPLNMGHNQLNGDFLINNTRYDPNIINFNIPLDNIEIWEIFNHSATSHPFHIHDVQFYILSRNGITPSPNEQGRKDVVFIRPMETIRFITKFEDFSNDLVPYMYHCHMLTHEDGGMMGQFIVEDKNVGLIDPQKPDFMVFPNPSDGYLTIKGIGEGVLEILSVNGQVLMSINVQHAQEIINLNKLGVGTYIIRYTNSEKQFAEQIIKL